MLSPRKIVADVYWTGAVDWDRRLFDDLIPLPDGTSYNAYVVQGSDRTALIDTVDPEMTSVLMGHLDKLGLEQLDYVVANHAEQDHSGALPQILERYPEAEVLTTPKGVKMLDDLGLVQTDRLTAVEDGETLSLGDKTLEFIHSPWVHWPETMMTYLREEKILFSCDFLGSHLATTDLYVEDEALVYEAAKRYYAEIMMPFSRVIKGHLKRLFDYEIEIIAPSHGVLYDQPELILEAYQEWVFGEPQNIVVLPYVSMHGSTRKMVEHLVDALVNRGVKVKLFNLTVTDIGELAMSLVDAATLVIGSPTVLTGPHPTVVSTAYLANALRPKLKFATAIGSYGWGGQMVKKLNELLSNVKAEWLEPVVVRGHPKAADLEALEQLADKIAEKHASLVDKESSL